MPFFSYCQGGPQEPGGYSSHCHEAAVVELLRGPESKYYCGWHATRLLAESGEWVIGEEMSIQWRSRTAANPDGDGYES